MNKGKADTIGSKSHACRVVDVVDKVVNRTLHNTLKTETLISHLCTHLAYPVLKITAGAHFRSQGN